MTDFDSPWKEALDVYFEQFISFLFPAVHRGVDWSRGYESLDQELRQVLREAELGRRVVDKLVRVWRADGEETLGRRPCGDSIAAGSGFRRAHVRVPLPAVR